MAKDKLIDVVARYNKAISEPVRMLIFKLVASSEPNTVNVSTVAQTIGISLPTASKHLRILEQAGFLARNRINNSVYYLYSEDNLKEYWDLMQFAFAHSITPCQHDYKCDSCPVRETCG